MLVVVKITTGKSSGWSIENESNAYKSRTNLRPVSKRRRRWRTDWWDHPWRSGPWTRSAWLARGRAAQRWGPWRWRTWSCRRPAQSIRSGCCSSDYRRCVECDRATSRASAKTPTSVTTTWLAAGLAQDQPSPSHCFLYTRTATYFSALINCLFIRPNVSNSYLPE